MTETVRLWMQEKLDGVLAEEKEQLLAETLQRDEQAAEEFGRLEQIDQALSRAPMLRASNRLAATIMARLATQLQMAAEIDQLPEDVRHAFLLSLSLVSLTTMPMMVASSWMLLNRGKTVALQHSIETAIALEVLLLRALVFLLQEVEQHLDRDPEKAQFILSALPVVFAGMLESLMPESLAQVRHAEMEEMQTTVKPARRVRHMPAADEPAADDMEMWSHLEESESETRPNRRSRLEGDS
jgi:hypothetical protein